MTALLTIIGLTLVQISEQVSVEPIIDSKTGRDLPLLTHTYYAIQNQKTLRFLIWFGKNGTVDSDPEETQGKYWHIFEKIDGDWYKMSHHFGSHNVKIAKSHEEGYYHIYNKDCFNGAHPNGDADDRGTIKCFVVEKGDLLEFNWRFLKKTETQDCRRRRKGEIELKYILIVFGIGVALAIPFIAFIKLTNKNKEEAETPSQVAYLNQENHGFVDTPVFPTQAYEKC